MLCMIFGCFSVVQEAVGTGDPDIVQHCLQYRDYQRHLERAQGIPKLLRRLSEVTMTLFQGTGQGHRA